MCVSRALDQVEEAWLLMTLPEGRPGKVVIETNNWVRARAGSQVDQRGQLEEIWGRRVLKCSIFDSDIGI